MTPLAITRKRTECPSYSLRNCNFHFRFERFVLLFIAMMRDETRTRYEVFSPSDKRHTFDEKLQSECKCIRFTEREIVCVCMCVLVCALCVGVRASDGVSAFPSV